MSYDSLLIDTCTIQQKSESQSNTGNSTFTWSTKASGVKCRKYRNNQPKIYDENMKVFIDQYKFYFLIGQSIGIENRILLSNGEVYEVVSVAKDSAGHHQEIFAKITKQ